MSFFLRFCCATLALLVCGCSDSGRQEWKEPAKDEARPAANTSWSAGSKAGEVRTVELPGRVLTSFVWIPPGSFRMGSDALEREKPEHDVTISKGFWLARTEVTQEQWEAVMGAGANPSNWQGTTLPVENVSWDDCQQFLNRLNEKAGGSPFRLPSEAEWEYACRAGSRTAFCFGDEEGRLGDHAWFAQNSGGQTHPVGGKRPNAWGCFDMHGNVYEWCEDAYQESYAGAPNDGRPYVVAGASDRVTRGGSCRNTAEGCRSSIRFRNRSGNPYYTLGFRPARSPG